AGASEETRTRPKNSRNANAPVGGNIRGLRLPKAPAQEWRTPAAAHSSRRRAAQSENGWQQSSSKLVKQIHQTSFSCHPERSVGPMYLLVAAECIGPSLRSG